MKILVIGGTGTISTAISKKLLDDGHDLFVLNRSGLSSVLGDAPTYIKADINAETAVTERILNDAVPGVVFDAVCEFIGFEKWQVERDFQLFRHRTRQYVYISSASAYEKPVRNPIITEETALANPYWQYSRNKIECENYLMERNREDAFPVTIVRPSHTYCERSVPLGIHGAQGSYQNLLRMQQGKPVIIHGDGTSLWTMTDSRDFAVAYTGLLGNSRAIGEAFHITSDESVTWNQIYQWTAQALGVELDAYHISTDFLIDAGKSAGYDFEGGLLGDKANSLIFDNSKVKKIVPEFTAAIRLKDGLKRTVDYVLSHEECHKPDPDFDQWCDRVIEAQERAKKTMR